MRDAFAADYYSVAAQLIAALFILIGVELRWLVDERRNDEDDLKQGEPAIHRWLAVATVVGLVMTVGIAEVSALTSLQSQRSTSHHDAVIWLSFASLMLVVLIVPLLPEAVRAFSRRLAAYTDLSERHEAGMAVIRVHAQTLDA